MILIDELGKGTSSVEGIGLAWAICEGGFSRLSSQARCFFFFCEACIHTTRGTELLQRKPVFTLCATHFPELNDLARMYPGAKNVTMQVAQDKGRLNFGFRPQPGVCVDIAYGIYLAGESESQLRI